jgi:hypothetical protein
MTTTSHHTSSSATRGCQSRLTCQCTMAPRLGTAQQVGGGVQSLCGCGGTADGEDFVCLHGAVRAVVVGGCGRVGKAVAKLPL